MAKFGEGMVDGRGVRLHYRAWDPASGASEHLPLLLLHGLASAARIWDLTAPSLAETRRVVALDQRGHGLSEKPDDGYDFASIVADDLAAADALDLGPRFAVAGHSWGANVALEFAAAHPERVAALLLVDGGFGMLRERPGATWERISQELAPPDFAGTPRETFLSWVRGSKSCLAPRARGDRPQYRGVAPRRYRRPAAQPRQPSAHPARDVG